MNKPIKTEKTRTTVTEQDNARTVASLHMAWRRDMARALGAVDTAKAAVEKMDATARVTKLLAVDKNVK